MDLKIKIRKLGIVDMLKFKNLPSRRDKAISRAKPEDIKTDFPINRNAKALHPVLQRMVIEKIVEHEKAGARTLVLRTADGKPCAWFRAGQYVSIKMNIGDSYITRPYSVSSSPALTREGRVDLTIKYTPSGFASDYLLNQAKIGDEIDISGAEGNFYYESLRDRKNVVAVAGGSGITPFVSMASAIRDGLEDFNLTILFGSRTVDSILFKHELDSIANSTDKVKIVHVLSDEKAEGYENGFITADLIRKYAPKDYSLFICGPEGLYRFMEGEVAKLGLPRRLVRREILGVSRNVTADGAFPQDSLGKTVSVTVNQGPETFTIPANCEENLLVALERAGIKAPARCRSGECGWCRSKLISGEVYVPEQNDGRRQMDRQTGHIHPCASFPVTDIVIEVPRGDIPEN